MPPTAQTRRRNGAIPLNVPRAADFFASGGRGYLWPGWSAREWAGMAGDHGTNRYPCAREKSRPHFRATFAGDADEVRFEVRQPDMIGPAVGADLDVTAVAVIAAIDPHIADIGCAHFAERDFCG